MRGLLILACSAVLSTGCYTYNDDVRTGDVMVDPAGAEISKGDPVPGETWSAVEPKDVNQRPYRYQFETERHQQYDSDPEFSHDRLD